MFEGGFIFLRSCLILFTVFKHQFGTEVLMKQGKRTNKPREPTNANERSKTNNKILKLLGKRHRNGSFTIVTQPICSEQNKLSFPLPMKTFLSH